MKPAGIAMGLNESGITLRVTRSSRATDQIWEAVEEAFLEGMTPETFMYEVRESWEQASKDKLKHDLEALK
jgi:hypothetical protein